VLSVVVCRSCVTRLDAKHTFPLSDVCDRGRDDVDELADVGRKCKPKHFHIVLIFINAPLLTISDIVCLCLFFFARRSSSCPSSVLRCVRIVLCGTLVIVGVFVVQAVGVSSCARDVTLSPAVDGAVCL
jgi:hypothetical protein